MNTEINLVHDETSFKAACRWRAERVVENLTDKMLPKDSLAPKTSFFLVNEILDELWHAYENFEEINEA